MGASENDMALRATAARRGMFTPLLDYGSKVYCNMLGKQLNKYGLRYEDILTETPEVMEALSRTSPADQEGRSMRIRRAVDLSFKKTYLPPSMQAANEPFKVYLMPHIKQVESEVWEEKEFHREHRPM